MQGGHPVPGVAVRMCRTGRVLKQVEEYGFNKRGMLQEKFSVLGLKMVV
jgi:hypothetical protein